jgi:hypothetical protein
MARDPAWTEQLGNAVLTQRSEVMDAVQRMRRKARDYGYLGPNGYVNVLTVFDSKQGEELRHEMVPVL